MPRPSRTSARGRRLCAAAIVAAGVAVGCRPPVDPPLEAEFLVTAGDSAFWVAADSAGPRVRRAPLWLVRHDDQWLEIYAADDDRSHRNAVFIGQRLWARDLVTGDSTLLAADTSALVLERDYARATPWDPPVRADEEINDTPSLEATADLVPLDLVGPFLGLELRTDIETADSARHRHEVRRGVVDLRRSSRITLPDVVGSRVEAIVSAGEAAWQRARDSVLAEASEAGRAASEAFADFPFDPSSFSLVVTGGTPAAAALPAVVFTVPGRGLRSGGYVLPLPPVPLARPAWWTPRARIGLGDDSAGVLRWRGDAYDVVAEPDSGAEGMRVSVHRAGRRPIALGRLPRPVRRLWRVDPATLDATTRSALDRAFNDAGLYGDDVRTARATLRPPARRTPAMLTSRP